jgi:hypothetical protein
LIEFKHILNPGVDDLEIEEPNGFDELELSIIRDEKLHGIGFEASTSALKFYGEAYDFLKQQKETYGLKANVIYQALSRCEGETEYTEVVKGRLNFAKYKASCGKVCEISLPIEQDGCHFTFKNRFDQKVDIDRNKAFDGLTVLPSYAALGVEMELPAKALLVSTEGNVADTGDLVEFDQAGTSLVQYSLRPTFGNTRFEALQTSQLTAPSVTTARNPEIVSPVILYEDDPRCFSGTFDLQMRAKGRIDVSDIAGGSEILQLGVSFVKTQGSYLTGTPTVLASQILTTNEVVGSIPHQFSFDLSYADPALTLVEGDNIFMLITGVNSAALALHPVISAVFEKETYFKLEGISLCPTTTADVNLIHETLSRTAEAISEGCVRVKSSFYGRTDSEPFSFSEDGCGSLRVLTSGLKIRKAPEEKFFVSMKELVEGLQAIDNIGMDIIPDPDRDNRFLVRLEDLEQFYQDEELLRLDAIPESNKEVEEARHYAKIKVGYKKWEVENINGLDEINSNREYRTSLTLVSNELDITSNLIAGSYAIEVTRKQSFAESGGADTKYDNETFVICVERDPNPYYDFGVEQGNILHASNIFSPDTLYNYRISPVRNLMRWYRSIVPSYANYADTTNKLFFGSGTGNLTAQGEMESNFCKIEPTSAGYNEGVIKENQDLYITNFSGSEYAPLWRNESVPFEYPLSVADYQRIKLNPYGYISFQCGAGELEKGWIKEIKFKPAKGLATFILRKQWQ